MFSFGTKTPNDKSEIYHEFNGTVLLKNNLYPVFKEIRRYILKSDNQVYLTRNLRLAYGY
jgi:uncharacterized membrane protein